MANKKAAKKQQAKKANFVQQSKPVKLEEDTVEVVKAPAEVVDAQVETVEAKSIEPTVNKKASKDETVKDDKNVKDAKTKKVKEKKPSRIGRKIKETGSELKKVTWPSFSTVVKGTGVVLAVVVFFTVVLFGFDSLFGWIYKLFTKSL